MIPDLKPYPIYKDSGVPWLGKVPEHWRVLPGRAVYAPKLLRNTGMVETTVLSLSYGRIIVKPSEKLHGLVPESFETYQIVDPDDIIVRTTDLQNDQTSLRVGQVDHRGIITAAYMCLATKEPVTSDFGYQLLNAYDLGKIIYAFGSGLRQNLDFSHIKSMPLPVPPPDEQAAIVRFLDHTDRRIQRYILAKQKLIKLLNEQKQAITHRAVTRGMGRHHEFVLSGDPWIGTRPKDWQELPFLRCTIERADYRGATPEKVESGVFLVTARNVRMGWIDYKVSQEYVRPDQYDRIMRRGLPRLGDVLLTMEAPLGNVALVDREDVAFAQRVVRFRMDPERLLPEFALHAFMSSYFQNQLKVRATGSTAHGIKASKLPQILVLVPPLDEQRQIMTHLRRELGPIDAAIARALREIELTREYRIRLVADVVTGKLDVREAARELPDEVDELAPTEDLEGEGPQDLRGDLEDDAEEVPA